MRRTIQPLITELSAAQSIEKLLQIFERLQANEHSSSSPTFYGPVNLHSQISKWKEQLQTAVNNYSKVQLALDEIKGPPKITPLINLIKYIMKTPELQVHSRIISLIMCLSSSELPTVLHFIANQEKAKLPENIPSGSFLAQIPIDSDHKHCLK